MKCPQCDGKNIKTSSTGGWFKIPYLAHFTIEYQYCGDCGSLINYPFKWFKKMAAFRK